MTQDFSSYDEKGSASSLDARSGLNPVQVLIEQLNRVGAELNRPGCSRARLNRVLGQSTQTLLAIPEFASCRSGQVKRNLLWGALETLTDQTPTRNSGSQTTAATYEEIESKIKQFFPGRQLRGTKRLTDMEPGTRNPEPGTPSLWVVSGIPGSGKSTWISTFTATATSPIVIVSTDDLRAELLGDATDQGANLKIFKTAHSRVRRALRAGISVIFDATNLLKKHRSQVWRIGRTCGARSIAVVLATPFSEALRRNQTRSRQVPEAVIARFFLQWQRPTLSEADERWVVET
ncbi:MAG: AAA family ATPase [Acidobacteria bacterium]|nr:AAA family ATPase [Acidobacteriota bacterium]